MRIGLVVLVLGCALVGYIGGHQFTGSPYGGPVAGDLPSNDVQQGTDTGLDRIQVVSSALRVTPHRDRYRGRRAAPVVTSWRRPRQHQFITKEDRVTPPPIIHVYPASPAIGAERRKSKRIIYYATLPEIVRPPGWYDTRVEYYDARPSNRQQYRYQSGYGGYQGYHSNDNDVTRVQSNIIDVTPPRNRFSSTPKFTIIDVEPPYNYNYNYNPPYSWQRRPTLPLPPYNDRPEPSLEPVKLEIPTAANSTESENSTRLLPDLTPNSLRSMSKFIT